MKSRPKTQRAGDCPGPLPAPRATATPELAEIRHALRTPINHILGYCEMLQEEAGLPKSFQRDLERIHASGHQLLGLINEYFDEHKPRPAQLDLHRLYHDLRTPVNLIIGYSELLQEEAEPAGHGHLNAELRKIRQAAATWLELAECHLNLNTPPDSQAPPGAPEKARPAPRQAPPAAPLPNLDGGRILVVDDDQDNRDILARRLERQGCGVGVAANGREAVRLVETQRFDLILLDLKMPGMDGLEVLHRIRAKWPVSVLPVIMLTAKDSSGDVIEALRHGANDFLTKPADFHVVLARAQTHLRLKKAQADLTARMEEIKQLAHELERRNTFIRQVFGRYLTDEVVQNLLDTPQGLELGGEKRRVTILMSDLRGFTTLAEPLPAERVVEILNLYLGTMAEVIARHRGTIDEFIGDAILAIFGAPLVQLDDPERAVACALAMQQAMDKVNERIRRLGGPTLQMGIGLNTGEVVVGNIGSAQRAKYGVVGHNVNLASRIQAVAAGGEVLISETTLGLVRPLLALGREQVFLPKGIDRPLKVYAVRAISGPYSVSLPP